MGTSRRTILSILSVILPATSLLSVSAEASTRTHAHHAKSTSLTAKSGHHAHKTAAAHSHKAPVAG